MHSLEYPLARVSRRAMATRFEIDIPARPDAVPAAQAALDLVDDLEDQLTVYRDHSAISRLNTDGLAEGVEPGLFDLLCRCAAWTRDTDGAFDIATGALTKAWGFYRREGRVPTPAERAGAMARTGMRHVILQPESRTVRFRVPGLELNLGAIGKGYALDRAAALLRNEWGIDSALLHAGGSSVLAIGHPPGDERGWPVALKHPTDESRTLGTVHLRDGGLGVSAATFQFFEYHGRKLGHVIDPRTGWPTEGTACAAATAPTAADADAASTAAFVFGTAAERVTRLRPEVGLVVLTEEPNPPTPFPLREGGAGLTPPSLRGKGVGGLGSLTAFNLAPTTYTPPSALAD